ncbi:hypothetical protein APHAL10511_005846 [Amanita phalloides]|nr:hypothetical protein APHAL10511_005846 [Amanita phalloides]
MASSSRSSIEKVEVKNTGTVALKLRFQPVDATKDVSLPVGNDLKVLNTGTYNVTPDGTSTTPVIAKIVYLTTDAFRITRGASSANAKFTSTVHWKE